MDTALQQRINAQLIRHLFNQLMVSQLASAGVLIALVLAFQEFLSMPFILFWVGAYSIVMLFRLAMLWAFRRREKSLSPKEVKGWGYWFAAGAALSGLVWGVASVMVMSLQHVAQNIMMLFALGGLMAGSSQSLGASLRSYGLFSLGMLLPASAWLLSQTSTTYQVLALLMLFFTAALYAMARVLNNSLRDSFRLGFENQGLVEELGAEVKTREISEVRLTDYNKILSKLAQQHPYESILKAINLMLEKHISGCKSSIMTLDGAGKRLHMASAPSLPHTYSQAIDGIMVGKGVGSCGTAVSTNQRVSVENILTDPLWANYKDIALAHGLQACTSIPIRDVAGNPVGTFALYHGQPHLMTADEDACLSSAAYLVGVVLERKRNEEKLHHLAHYDGLTSLPNRTLFNDRLQHTLARAKRDKKKFALLFMDLDKFKAINDEQGHAVGDLVLQEVAKRLRQCVRDVDTAARMGGDEFTVLITDVNDAQSPALVANKIISLLSKPIVIEGAEYSLGVSIGISLYPEDELNADQLVTLADAAMYQAKKLGGNVAIFHSTTRRSGDASLTGLFTAANDLAA
ncbi:MAG: diguanylate cyclase domain-containing protein [Methylophilaceae bacterium]